MKLTNSYEDYGNLDFDFVSIYNRIKKLGYDPKDFFSSNDMPYKKAYYNLDTKYQNMADRSSSFITSSYTTWIDQLSLYANINKPKGVLDSYSLNNIAEIELGLNKTDLNDGEAKGTDVTNIYRRNYYKFVLYNIQDTMLLSRIERKVTHLDLLYTIASVTRTRISHALKKTTSLRNLADVFYHQKGMAISNNRSRLYPHTGEKIPGGFVGDPTLMDNVGIKTENGMRSNRVFNVVTDIDLTALYPHIQIAYNISPESFAGRVQYVEKILTDEISGRMLETDKTENFIDEYNSRDSVSFCRDYYGLPGFSEMEKLVKEDLAKDEGEE